MIKVVAIGDVHGQWAEVWQALKYANACDHRLKPTAAVLEGRMHVIFLGDLVHYKDALDYEQAVGEETYDPTNPQHLKRAAKAQIRELYRFKDFVDETYGRISIVLGNHDESALNHKFQLSTRSGLKHDEFNEAKGGVPLPDDLKDWFGSFVRELVLYDVQFAHAGPSPGMQYFDDFFYHDEDTKKWWFNKPKMFSHTGYRFGVYGHTVMKEGIYIDEEHQFAMIDALGDRQYLELILDQDRLDYQIVKF